jgi:hypothetical protein
MHLARRRNVIDEQKLAATVTLHNGALIGYWMTEARGTVKRSQSSVQCIHIHDNHSYN